MSDLELRAIDEGTKTIDEATLASLRVIAGRYAEALSWAEQALLE